MSRSCKECKGMYEDKDFLGGQKYPDVCYKCLYGLKLTLCPKILKCKVCEDRLPRGKWKYCSEECLEIGSKKMKREYWTCNIAAPQWT